MPYKFNMLYAQKQEELFVIISLKLFWGKMYFFFNLANEVFYCYLKPLGFLRTLT